MITNRIYARVRTVLMVLVLFVSLKTFPQETDSLHRVAHIDGSVTLTNNGISTIPSFTLGKPALLFALSAGRKFRFEPEFRLSWEAKPWMFIFWGRYDGWKPGRHVVRPGVNMQFNFKEVEVAGQGSAREFQAVSRFLSADLSYNCLVTKNSGAGAYYLYSRSLENEGPFNLHYLALKYNFLNITLPANLFAKFAPQIYYLRVDETDGYYFTETLTLAKKNCPVSVSSIVTTPIKTHILINNHLVWNVNLTYSFRHAYVRKF